MKKRILSGLLAVLLIATMCVGFAGCEKKDEGPITVVSAYKSKGDQKVDGHFSWEDINKFPVKNANMSIQELRQLCVDFFRYAKTAKWIPDDNWAFSHGSDGRNPDVLSMGQIYAGFPYVGLGTGNLYQILDYMDPETGVVNMKDAGEDQRAFGNQCANGAYQGWARVINSVDYNGTPSMVPKNGFVPLGEYYYPEYTAAWTPDYGTDEVCKENGLEVLAKSYAEMKLGDGLVNYTTAGHVMMVSSDAHVEYTKDGKIDPSKSYVTVIDQTSDWAEGTTEDGKNYKYQANVDWKRTFVDLFNGYYIPFTYKEFLGEDPIEETEISCSYNNENITPDALYSLTVKSNYHIFDIYAIVKDARGSEVYKLSTQASRAAMHEITFTKDAMWSDSWGELEDLDPKKEYTVEIVAQLGTGERPTVYTGKLDLG